MMRKKWSKGKLNKISFCVFFLFVYMYVEPKIAHNTWVQMQKIWVALQRGKSYSVIYFQENKNIGFSVVKIVKEQCVEAY